MVRIIRRHPAFHPHGLEAELNRMFGGLLPPRPEPGAPRVELELREGEQGFVVRAELPGVDPASIELTATADRLVLAGEKPDVALEGSERRYSERRFGAFRRELALPAEIDPAAVVAEHAHGVLTVTLPRSAAQQPRRIEVQAS